MRSPPNTEINSFATIFSLIKAVQTAMPFFFHNDNKYLLYIYLSTNK